jgi:hypothetical protein
MSPRQKEVAVMKKERKDYTKAVRRQSSRRMGGSRAEQTSVKITAAGDKNGWWATLLRGRARSPQVFLGRFSCEEFAKTAVKLLSSLSDTPDGEAVIKPLNPVYGYISSAGLPGYKLVYIEANLLGGHNKLRKNKRWSDVTVHTPMGILY